MHEKMMEGVIQFQAHHKTGHLSLRRYADATDEVLAWREILRAMQIVGQHPDRYDGAGFGNLSVRVGPFPGQKGARPFLITGTQTGGERCLSLADFALVHRYDVHRNEVRSEGERLPSSESMTHGALYDLTPAIRCVMHVHAPVLFEQAKSLGLPTTDAAVGYGTPAMAQAMGRLWRTTPLEQVGVLVMGGHEDGVVGFGRTVAEAGHRILGTLARALVLGKPVGAPLCRGALVPTIRAERVDEES